MNKQKTINIFGSTGQIGSKTLLILNKYFPYIKINLLVANKNYKKLIEQTKSFEPKNIYINDESKIEYLKRAINTKKTTIIKKDEIYNYINSTKSDITLLSISGYQSLQFLPNIIKNTKTIGLVNKESIVSAGHLISKLNINKVLIFPIDSEHFSLYNILKNNNKNKVKKIILTASGGPFFKNRINKSGNFSFKNAKNHPKWKMGYKNSIDSATLVNKCLELIEAHYLFQIPFDKLDIVIHPEALVHSIIEYENYTSVMNYFYHDMFIPIFNFLAETSRSNDFPIIDNKFDFNLISKLNFYKPNLIDYPILKIFNKIDKSLPINLIKFNCANEFAVNLFARKKINFGDIHKIIAKSLSLDLNTNINNVNNIIKFQENYVKKLKYKFVQ